MTDKSHKYPDTKELIDTLRTQPTRERLLNFLIVNFAWMLIPLVYVVSLLLDYSKSQQAKIDTWLYVYVAYQLILFLGSKYLEKIYKTPFSRMFRVQGMVIFSGWLTLITGGHQSIFWFVFLWSLMSVSFYFENWMVTSFVYAEVALIYLAVSYIAVESFNNHDFVSLFLNISILLLFTFVFRYLVQSIKTYQSAQYLFKFDQMLGLKATLDNVLKQTVELVNARSGSLMLLEEGDNLVFKSRVGEFDSSEEDELIVYSVGRGIAGFVAKTQDTYYCRDTMKDQKFVSGNSEYAIRSLISVPIISRDLLLGVLNVDSDKPDFFSQVDVNLVETLASQIAISIERANLVESLRKLGKEAIKGTGTADVYKEIVTAVHEFTACPVALWRVEDENPSQARIQASVGLRGAYVERRTLNLEKSATGIAIKQSKIVEVLNIQEHTEVSPETKIEAENQGWFSMLIVPLLTDTRRSVGTLSLYGKQSRIFSDWERDALQLFANQASVAIQNMNRLQFTKELNEVGELISRLDATPDVLKKTLAKIADGALEVLSADLVSIYQYHADAKEFELPPVVAGELLIDDMIPGKINDDDAVATIIKSGESVFASNAQSDPILSTKWSSLESHSSKERFVFREKIQSTASLLLEVSNEILGVLFVSYRQKRDFEADIGLRNGCEIFAKQAAVAINNARNQVELHERANRMSLLQNIRTVISSKLDISKVVKDIVKGVVELADADSGVMHLVDREEKQIQTSYEFPENKGNIPTRFSKGKGLTFEILDTGKTIEVFDTLEDQRISQTVIDNDVRSVIGFPLGYSGRIVGVLFLNDLEPRIYSNEEKTLLNMLVDQAGVAIENARLFDQLEKTNFKLKRKVQEQKAVNQLGRTLTAQIDLSEQQVVELIFEQAEPLMHTENMYVALYEQSTDAVSFPLMFVDGERKEVETREAGAGRTEHIIRTKEPLLIPTEEKSKAWYEETGRKEYIGESFASWLGVPMLIGDQALGVIATYHKTDDYVYDEDDQAVLESIASQAAIALQNIHYVDELEAFQDLAEDFSAGSFFDEE